MILLLPDSSAKFTRKWQGPWPFKLKRRVGRVNFEVESGSTKVYHLNLLKKWHPREEVEHNYTHVMTMTLKCPSTRKRDNYAEIQLGDPKQRRQLNQLLNRYPQVTTGRTTLLRHRIPTVPDCRPVRQTIQDPSSASRSCTRTDENRWNHR